LYERAQTQKLLRPTLASWPVGRLADRQERNEVSDSKSDVILHHYPASPFAEKIRVVLGIKGLTWQSVHIPRIMPKPDLMPLTGGYRKTPVMQIGADVYCDTQIIVRELERRYPNPSLYRGTDAGTANAFAFWSERATFGAAVGTSLAKHPEVMTPEFMADRSKFSGRPVNIEQLQAATPMLLDQLRAQLGWYETTLADGRAFLLGKEPTLVDAAVYHIAWFMDRGLGRSVAPLAHLPRFIAWIDRVKAIGHGTPTPLDAKDALAIAKAATPTAERVQDANDPAGRKPGDRVQVVPDDTGRDPVAGELISSSADEIVIRRVDPVVGEIAVHFPRAGFVVQPAA
jgi:glutathione S-transferase